MIKAPYNFVPLNEKVFYPEWSEQVSHDIPFSDGESGEIEIEIEAKSPIFVRDNNSKDETKFCNYNGEYFIPATSIKGMIRNILEIISFSKLKIQDKILSYRDLNNPSYKKNAMNTNKIYMGWLYIDKNRWKVDSVGKITNSQTRIKYIEMEKFLGKKIVDKIKNTKEAYKKYQIINDRDKLEIQKGTIVFTGSIGKKKTREFLFPKKVEKTYILDDKVIKTFKEGYYIGTPNESKDWKNLWSNELKKGKKIPIFFQIENNKIKHFGLSMLYKLPYTNSLQKLLENYQNYKDNKDLAQTIFGDVNNDNSLKGRVYFSHFKCYKEVPYNKTISLPLSTPRATFYPNYIVQCGDTKTQEFITYDNENAILRGFKLYPPRKNIITYDEICKKNSKVCTSFKPLNKGSIFKGKIRFHNLKKEEIGVLLSALTILNNKDSFHKVGMAKGYGFGTIKINILKLITENNFTQQQYIDSFITLIDKKLNINLLNSPRIKALFKLTSYSFSDKELKYMPINDFVNAKKTYNKWVLKEIVDNGYNKDKICKKKNNKKSNQNKKNPVFNGIRIKLN